MKMVLQFANRDSESSIMNLKKNTNYVNWLMRLAVFQSLVMVSNALGDLQECVLIFVWD